MEVAFRTSARRSKERRKEGGGFELTGFGDPHSVPLRLQVLLGDLVLVRRIPIAVVVEDLGFEKMVRC